MVNIATILDVAHRAGVSRSTVSLVINNSPLVKDETKEKVQNAIKELNYVPNNNARGLSSKVMNSLGIIKLSDYDQSYCYNYEYDAGLFSFNITNGIMEVMADTDYSVITESFNITKNGNDLPKIIRNRRIDGAIVIGGLHFKNYKIIDNILKSNIPLVLVGTGNKEELIDSVIADSEEGTYLGIKHLAEKGHKKICHVNCPTTFTSHYRRDKGIKHFIEESGMVYNGNLMLTCEENSGKGGYDAIKKLWESGERPDGIFTANPQIALGVMRYLYGQNVHIPNDISIVTYEDNVLCGYAVTAITSINIQKEYMGKLAANMLLARLKNPDKEVESITVRPYIVERSSVKNRY